MKKFAVITGVSKGIGFGYAKILLESGYNVIGISRNTEPFAKLTKQFPNAKIIPINLDLSNPDNIQSLYENIKDYPIDLVINNAGFGNLHVFATGNLETDLNMIDLNIKHVHIMTHCFLKKLILQGYGTIVNISSIVAFMPMAFFQTYAATKAYVLHLSRAINQELKLSSSPVRVVTVCPGSTESDFQKRALPTDNPEVYKMGNKFKKMSAEELCGKSLAIINKKPNRDLVVIGCFNKFLLFASKILPNRWTCWMAAKVWQKPLRVKQPWFGPKESSA